jgi:hypothetical protein
MGSGYRFGQIIPLFCCAVVLAGCGGDDGGTGSSWMDWVRGRGPTTGNNRPPPTQQPAPEPEPEPQPAPNTAPTLSGTPATSVVADSPYRFVPKAQDADGDRLVFSIQNKPNWATFSTSTGELSGTPNSSHIGTYSNVIIAVTDGKATTRLRSFSITVEAVGGGVATLTWTPPTQKTDGSPLSDLSGYKIYWGQESGKYTKSVQVNNPGISSYVVDDLGRGTYYFAVTALARDGVESEFSNEATKTIR